MKVEADDRNENLTEDDLSKNLRWAVVGARGERRLIKTKARNRQEGNSGAEERTSHRGDQGS